MTDLATVLHALRRPKILDPRRPLPASSTTAASAT